MASYALKVKRKLNKILRFMSQNAENFSKRPGKDFSRKGKLGIEKTISILLSMEGKSLNNELLTYFSCAKDSPTASAFVQSRAKLHPEALPFLFSNFVKASNTKILYKGLRLFAVDGTTIQIPCTPEDKDSLVIYSDRIQPVNMLHMNALYDLCGHTYADVIIEGKQVYNEQRALIQLCHRNPFPKALFIADRGYESLNLMAHVQQCKALFLIRVRDACGLISGLPLPNADEFDCSFALHLSPRRDKHTRSLFRDKHHYKFVQSNKLDYGDLSLDAEGFFLLLFRVVRFRVSDNLFETVVTNLDSKSFPASELKHLYAVRWGIESSFRKLKYTLGLLAFHAKKVEYIQQEIFARLIMYNFCELITSHAIIHADHRKFSYAVNFSASVHICRQFFRGNVSPPLVETLISRFVSPIRPDRSFSRTPHRKGLVSFQYRIA